MERGLATARVVIVPRPAFARGANRPDQPLRPGAPTPPGGSRPRHEEEDRPPVCPVCQKRLVILAMHPGRDPDGRPIRRQLWGCPRGHATAYRVGGVFGPFEYLDDGDDE